VRAEIGVLIRGAAVVRETYATLQGAVVDPFNHLSIGQINISLFYTARA
jgi:hypothetical protein